MIWLYVLLSVIIVSLVSLIGVFTFSLSEKRLENILIYFVSFSVGALFGDVFIHLIPEIVERGFSIHASLYILFGILFSFIVEKFFHWRHCHNPETEEHVHTFAKMNLFGDLLHNFIDGLVIGASYVVSIPVGVASTIAIIFHEIPQEIGDFGVLLRGGFSKVKALVLNFVTALTAVLGAVVALILSSKVDGMIEFLIPFAAGSFIYIAGSDLIPELHKEGAEDEKKALLQMILFVFGIIVMSLLLLLE